MSYQNGFSELDGLMNSTRFAISGRDFALVRERSPDLLKQVRMLFLDSDRLPIPVRYNQYLKPIADRIKRRRIRQNETAAEGAAGGNLPGTRVCLDKFLEYSF